MAISKNGYVVGRIGNTVSYPLNGDIITRTIGEPTKNPSKAQLAIREKTKVMSTFLNSVMPLIEIGFGPDAKRQKKHPQNLAFAHNWRNALRGTYPHISVDFEKVLLSSGSMPTLTEANVKIVDAGLLFTWDTGFAPIGTHWNDRVMLAAYFPELNKAQYVITGANREQGNELLPLNHIEPGYSVETYISFISNNHKRISNSKYVGRLLW